MNNNGAKEQLDVNKVIEEKIKFLEAHMYLSLATSLNDRVTVRTVTYVSDGLDIYFLSCNHHTKCIQINGNPKVAACIDNVQIEGKAQILGNPTSENNKKYADIYRKKLPEIYKYFAPKPEMVIVKITPTFFATLVRNSVQEHLEHLDLEKKTAYIYEEFEKN